MDLADRATTFWSRRLAELGIERGGIKDAPYGSGLSFRDPDGTALEFFAPRRPGPASPRPPIVAGADLIGPAGGTAKELSRHRLSRENFMTSAPQALHRPRSWAKPQALPPLQPDRMPLPWSHRPRPAVVPGHRGAYLPGPAARGAGRPRSPMDPRRRGAIRERVSDTAAPAVSRADAQRQSSDRRTDSFEQ
jgi:hypothetical protein